MMQPPVGVPARGRTMTFSVKREIDFSPRTGRDPVASTLSSCFPASSRVRWGPVARFFRRLLRSCRFTIAEESRAVIPLNFSPCESHAARSRLATNQRSFAIRFFGIPLEGEIGERKRNRGKKAWRRNLKMKRASPIKDYELKIFFLISLFSFFLWRGLEERVWYLELPIHTLCYICDEKSGFPTFLSFAKNEGLRMNNS